MTKDSPAGPKQYHCGTLVYTKASLAVLFAWLFWGDICYTLMEDVTHPIMQLKLKALGVSNKEIGLILTTIPGIVVAFVNPIFSFKSDRFRSRLGRRIPFLIASLPFVTLALVALAFGDQIGMWFYSRLQPTGVSLVTVMTVTLAVLLVTFRMFDTCFTNVFWYLFRDVVPQELLARFMSWFRMIALGSNALYGFFIFQYSGTHSTEIFLGAAALYLVGFGMMCFNVREGKYPPPPAYVGGRTGPVAAIRTYGRECHALPHYWYVWVGTFFSSVGAGAVVFHLFFLQRIGLTLGQIGHINAIANVVTAVLVLGTGWLADKYHPIRVVMAASFLGLMVFQPVNLIWLHWCPPPDAVWRWHLFGTVFQVPQAYFVQFCITISLRSPVMAMVAMWDPVLLMRILPSDRFGQFAANNAVWRLGGTITGAFLAGTALDLMGRWVGRDDAYLYIPVWQIAFGIPALMMWFSLYRSWRRYGGDKDYVAPLPQDTLGNENAAMAKASVV